MDAVRQQAEGEHTRTVKWKPNEECLEQLLSMGIDRSAALKALYYTGNHSVEFAANYVFQNPDLDEDLDGSVPVETRSDGEEEVSREFPVKMVFVVNGSLSMSVGKTSAQVAHATRGVLSLLTSDKQRFGRLLRPWEENGEKMVVLHGDDESQLKHLARRAEELNVPHFLVTDAGRTEIASGSNTVLSLFGREDRIDSMTGHLSLL